MKHAHKRFGRGAAMIEAAVVLPVMISFLGLTMMMGNAYSTKLTKNQQSRSMVLDFASHECKRQVITYDGTSRSSSATNVGSAAPTGAGADATEALNQSPNSATTNGFMAKANVSYNTSTVVNPKPNSSTRGMGLTIQVNGATSTALCNETPQDGNFSGMFGYIKGKIL